MIRSLLQLIPNTITYEEYQKAFEANVKAGRTSGERQSEDFIRYTKLNLSRSNRVAKQVTLYPELEHVLGRSYARTYWVVFTEFWCGDAAQNLPILHLMAAASPGIELRLLFRDEHPEAFGRYLTNGSRSIPKLVAINAESGEEQYTWGPRPAVAQQMMLDYKAGKGPDTYEAFGEQLHKWYAENRGKDLQNEFLELLGKI